MAVSPIRPPLSAPYASPSPPFTLTARWPRAHLARASRMPWPAAAPRSDRARLVARTAPHHLLRPRSRSLRHSPRAPANASPTHVCRCRRRPLRPQPAPAAPANALAGHAPRSPAAAPAAGRAPWPRARP
nr:testis-specific gene A8 protein-like [Aegilops tauschii subsp. strangulata]